jgi:raffinose/stachyose/melibiose transport system substrate-binding protein
MMSQAFFTAMTKTWPGYWGVPLKSLSSVDPSQFSGLSAVYAKALQDMNAAVASGNFGLDISTFFPPGTQTALTDIDTVWLGKSSAAEFLARVQTAYDKDKASNLLAPVPEPKS